MENKIGFSKNSSLFELAEVLGRQSDYKEILRVVSEKTANTFNADIASILMVNPQSKDDYKTIMRKETSVDKKQFSIVQSIIIGWVMLNKKPILIENLREDKRFKQDIFKEFPIQSAICTPLFCSDTRIGYVIVMNRAGKGIFNEVDLDQLKKIAIISAPYLSNMQRIQEYFNVPLPESSLINKYKIVGLLGKSKKFIELLHSIEAASKCDVRVVLEGETGTGKELIVKAIHNFSKRSGFPFVAVDCGAIPSNLIESELFGHVKGAFTGANKDHVGLIEQANRGTLFLDEISNLSWEMQAKLLRVLQEGEIRAVGDTKVKKINVRIISATSISLSELVEEKKFRSDLFYRLAVYPIKVPTLEERKPDIELLAKYFLTKFSKEQGRKIEFLHSEIINYLTNKTWPGNIRELQNFMERLVTVCDGSSETVSIKNLPKFISEQIEEFNKSNKAQNLKPLISTIENYEKEIIIQTLDDSLWNQSQAARVLDIPEQTLRYKMKKLGIFRVK